MQSLSQNVMEIRALCEASQLRLAHDGNCFIRNAEDIALLIIITSACIQYYLRMFSNYIQNFA